MLFIEQDFLATYQVTKGAVDESYMPSIKTVDVHLVDAVIWNVLYSHVFKNSHSFYGS